MSCPNDRPAALALELMDEQVQISLTFSTVEEAEAAYDRMAAALRAGTGFTIGSDKPLTLIETGGTAQ